MTKSFEKNNVNVNKLKRYLIWLRHKIKNYFNYGFTDLFSDIEIETNTACNRRCIYCPNSVYDRGLLKNQKLMEEKVFKKIIDELAEIKFKGRVSPHHYGEPLLDKRLPKLMKYIRDKLPKTKIIIASNGDYLTKALFNKLVKAGVDLFNVTQHGKSMSKNIKELLTKSKHKDKIRYIVFTEETPLISRGGLVKLKKDAVFARCMNPANPLVIDAEGNVILCCNDFLSSVKFGNVKKQKLLDIWFSKKYVDMRNELKKGIFRLDMCKKCAGQ